MEHDGYALEFFGLYESPNGVGLRVGIHPDNYNSRVDSFKCISTGKIHKVVSKVKKKYIAEGGVLLTQEGEDFSALYDEQGGKYISIDYNRWLELNNY
ncbi:hypothetical protein I2712_002341 [Vibrio fluvialis]|nr:hypothetical protein [Vibrio fluvialis]ELF6479740.1 hypothetical protein [Vibrio fluvialis]